ncbi:hypothetical protein M1N50_00175 [Dehalococcoidia bacterium]|nr:hypothetical protein [Dehalococcoidia bacterium]
MEISLFLAQFWGWFLVITGLPFLLKKGLIIRLLQEKWFVRVCGGTDLILGLVTVILHNLWVTDWRIVITIIGWIFLFTGGCTLVWSGSFIKQTEEISTEPKTRLEKTIQISLIIIQILLGVYLIWMSF